MSQKPTVLRAVCLKSLGGTVTKIVYSPRDIELDDDEINYSEIEKENMIEFSTFTALLQTKNQKIKYDKPGKTFV